MIGRTILGIALAVSVSTSSYALVGQVVAVADGDTLTVLSETGKTQRVRLASIDAPEKAMEYGKEARDTMVQLALGKLVSVTEDGYDAYGRLIGIVSHGNVSLNEKMVKLGMAWVFCDKPETPQRCKYLNERDWHFEKLQEEARRMRAGLWAQEMPIPPWDYRKGRKEIDLTTATCQSMMTCEQAKEALAAGNKKIDGDGDGVPCELLCK